MLLSMKCVTFQSVEPNEEDGSLHPVLEHTVYCGHKVLFVCFAFPLYGSRETTAVVDILSY